MELRSQLHAPAALILVIGAVPTGKRLGGPQSWFGRLCRISNLGCPGRSLVTILVGLRRLEQH
jgi:hypothetical protein